MALPQARPVIAAMPRYVPGARGAAQGPPPIKLSSNETPFPPLPGVVEAAAAAAAAAHRYPDMFAVELTEALAARDGLAVDQVVVAAGSVAVLGHLLQAYSGPGDEVVFAWRSFEAYPILAQVAGATPVPVPLAAGFRHDLPAMAAAVTERTKAVLLCSPNNPTGPVIEARELEEFMAAVPTEVLVVLDEAYAEFVRDPGAADGRALLASHPNLVVARTFSKAYGLAGLRVGYAWGAAEVLAPVRACVTPFSLSGVAQAAALASLAASDALMERVERVVLERERVAGELRAAGWALPEAQGNFFWVPAGEKAGELAERLAAAEPSVLVRPFAGEGVRVTIGDVAENDALLALLATYGPVAYAIVS